ncbi:MAG: DUF4199 domain-containing protein [Balneolaceae bacterium]
MDEFQTGPKNSSDSYWASVLLAGGIFALVSFVLSLIFSYSQINSEPTGTLMSPIMIGGSVICFVTAFAGVLAIWHYAKEVTPYIKLGQGALIGFLAGAAVIIFSSILNELWTFIDPEFTEKLIESTVANYEAMDLPEDTKNMLIDGTVEAMRDQNILWQILTSIPVTGLLNLLTGMIGVKIFAKKEDGEF